MMFSVLSSVYIVIATRRCILSCWANSRSTLQQTASTPSPAYTPVTQSNIVSHYFSGYLSVELRKVVVKAMRPGEEEEGFFILIDVP